MFQTVLPEQAGISSKAVLKFFKKMEERGVYLHGTLMMRGDDIFSECYWKPYCRESINRMYSRSKSFVGIPFGHHGCCRSLGMTAFGRRSPHRNTPINSNL